MTHRTSLRFIRSAVAMTLLGSTSIASAQPQPPPPSAAASTADALFQRAKEAAKRGDWDAACRDFAESQAKDPAPGTLLNLGDCEEHKGQFVLASRHFVQALQGLPSGDPRAAYTQDRIKKLEPRFALLTVVLPPGSTFMGTKVFRGGEEMTWSELGKPQRVDPGEVTLIVRSRNAEDRRIAVTLRQGESREIKIGTKDEASTKDANAAAATTKDTKQAPASTREQEQERRPESPRKPMVFPRRTVQWIALGAGAVGVAVGATTGILALGAASTFRDGCPNGACRDQESLDAGNRASSLATWSTVSFAVGLVGLGVGSYLLFTTPKSSAAPATALTRPTVSPVVTQGGGGLHLIGTF